MMLATMSGRRQLERAKAANCHQSGVGVEWAEVRLVGLRPLAAVNAPDETAGRSGAEGVESTTCASERWLVFFIHYCSKIEH